MRRKVVAGNWKMNTTVSEGEKLAERLVDADVSAVDVIVAPPFTHLDRVGSVLEKTDIALAAQTLSVDTFGAHTGEVAGEMLADLGCSYVIVGHSESRGRGENDEIVAQKIERAFETGLTPIICIGEDEEVYNSGERLDFLKGQVRSALGAVDSSKAFMFAYEPIWAIGTGKTASADDAQSVIGEIRGELPKEVADDIRILYGGSVKAENVEGFLSKDDVDGVLVGGASLKADSFKAIIDGASHV
ncbi:MAG: triose-phosphate isomerase [Peptoniphilus sp.]|nr:triose-phosphate isomerase [Peptoniphilus sp.]MDD7363775.1 triose-phosphate isomerase [Bacillota bacterium]MDY6044616.1 triose-phosphate isomerase [Peptoniphilus sp.]